MASKYPPHLITIPNELKDMIASNLPMRDLASLRRINKAWNAVASRCLYIRDAQEQGSRAIRWAALHGHSGARGGCQVNVRIIRQSLRFGGDVNAVHTEGDNKFAQALHLAAARNRLPLVRLLLQMNADIVGLSSGLKVLEKTHIMPAPGRERAAFLSKFGEHVQEALKITNWLPLAAPFLLRHDQVIRALINAGAPAQIGGVDHGWHIADNHHVPAITIFHIMAVMSARELNDELDNSEEWHGWRNRRGAPVRTPTSSSSTGGHLYFDLFRNFPKSLDTPLPYSGFTALHLAILHNNSQIFERLLAHGANVGARTAEGLTPLTLATLECSMTYSAPIRRNLVSCIRSLLNAGADPNEQPLVHGKTPLIS